MSRFYVTLREIEELEPCAGDYAKFLVDIKSRPVSDKVNFAYRPEKSQYGPDDPIPVEAIIKNYTRRSKDTPEFRLNWLAERIKRLRPLRRMAEQMRNVEYRKAQVRVAAIVKQKKALQLAVSRAMAQFDAEISKADAEITKIHHTVPFVESLILTALRVAVEGERNAARGAYRG